MGAIKKQRAVKPSIDRALAIHLFEAVHARQLSDAHFNLRQMYPGSRWRIALKERLMLAPLSNESRIPAEPIVWVVDVRLNGDKLEAADKTSEQAIAMWEERYAGAEMRQFFMPKMEDERREQPCRNPSGPTSLR
jgi:hypothetical protein